MFKRKSNVARRTKSAKRQRTSAIVKMAPRISATRPEKKSTDIATRTDAITSTAVVVCLNVGTSGATSYQRSGRRSLNTSVHVRGVIQNDNAGASSGNDIFRIAIVYDKQTNSSLPGWSDVFRNTTSAGADSTDALSFRNLDNADRFVVLRDMKYKTHSYDIGGGALDNPVNEDFMRDGKWFFDEYIPLPAKKGLSYETHFNAVSNAGTVGDILTGGIFLLIMGSQLAANRNYSAQWNSRVRFMDF